MSLITTHVLDTALGRPADGVDVTLRAVKRDGDEPLASSTTDEDGRVGSLGPAHLEPGLYRLVYDVAAYHTRTGQPSFFPEVSVTFRVENGTAHLHLPVLLSPYAYSTYRGS